MTSSMNQRRFYQQIILEHSKNLGNRGKTNPVDGYHRGHNPMCGDTIELTIQLNPTGDRIEDIKFEGTGCAIASGDLMADTVRGQSIAEALSMV